MILYSRFFSFVFSVSFVLSVAKNTLLLCGYLCKTNPILSAYGGFKKRFNLSNNNDYELLPAIRVAGRTIQNKPNQTQPVVSKRRASNHFDF